jgi:hypothetical protein
VIFEFIDRKAKAFFEPGGSSDVILRLLQAFVYLPSLYESEGIPDFIGKVTTLLYKFLGVEKIVASRRAEQHSGSYAIGAVVGDQVEWIGRVAQ